MDDTIFEQAEIEVKYAGYIEKEKRNADKLKRLENIRIPINFDFDALASLSYEAKEKLNKLRPKTLAQASRLAESTRVTLVCSLCLWAGNKLFHVEQNDI